MITKKEWKESLEDLKRQLDDSKGDICKMMGILEMFKLFIFTDGEGGRGK